MTAAKPRRLGLFGAAGLVVAVAVAFLAGPRASSAPDGLQRVAVDQGFDATARSHSLDDVPTAGYAVRGVGDGPVSRGLAGVIGVVVTFAVAGTLLVVVRRRAAVRGRSAAP